MWRKSKVGTSQLANIGQTLEEIMIRVFCLLIVLSTILVCAACNMHARLPNQGQLTSAQTVNREDLVRELIKSLSDRSDKRRAAEQEAIRVAQQSTSQRQKVIQALIEDVNRHDELRNKNAILTHDFDYWSSVTNIFSTLQAVEAVDIMIKCIYCGNGLTGSLSQRPAFDALSKMGELAVPRLSEFLTNDSDDYARAQIALCLGNIGGPRAKKALEHALRVEHNKDVARHIRWGLATIAGDPSKYW